MVVDGHGQDLLRALLADHVIVEGLLDLGGLREAPPLLLEGPLGLVLPGDDVVAELDALVADVDRGTRDELANLVLRLSAEGADQQVRLVVEFPGQRGPPSVHQGFEGRGTLRDHLVNYPIRLRLVSRPDAEIVEEPEYNIFNEGGKVAYKSLQLLPHAEDL